MRQKLIFKMFFFDGLAPSQIDRQLGLIRGTARQVIVEHWRWGNTEKN